MSDIIIGAISNYTYDVIEPWVNSIKKIEFTGRKVMIIYGECEKDLTDKLHESGFEILRLNSPEGVVHVDRFLHVHEYLNQFASEKDRVVFTDVRDVVFQTDPFKKLRKPIVVGSENFSYANEPWSRQNMLEMFGREAYNRLSQTSIYCCGVIGGNALAVSDLLFATYMICKGPIERYGAAGISDQSGMNVILSLSQFKDKTMFCTTEDDFVCHLGTSMEAIRRGSGEIGRSVANGMRTLQEYEEMMLFEDVQFEDDRENIVVNNNGDPYAIVHQYDRVGEIGTIIERRYRS